MPQDSLFEGERLYGLSVAITTSPLRPNEGPLVQIAARDQHGMIVNSASITLDGDEVDYLPRIIESVVFGYLFGPTWQEAGRALKRGKRHARIALRVRGREN